MPCARSHARSPPPPCHSPRATAPPAARRRRAAPLCPTPPLAARCSAPPHRLVSQHRSPPHRSLRRSLRHSLRCSLRRSAHCTARRAPLVAPLVALLVSICKGSEGTHDQHSSHTVKCAGGGTAVGHCHWAYGGRAPDARQLRTLADEEVGDAPRDEPRKRPAPCRAFGPWASARGPRLSGLPEAQ
jgi:hypothetical protein